MDLPDLPYPRLYLRLAVWIGVALTTFILFGAASLALIASWELRGYIATKQSSLGQEAADVLTAGGRPALERWLRDEVHPPPNVTVYVLDADSHDILDRPVPGPYAGFVRNTVVGNPEPPGTNYRGVRLAPQLIAPDGTVYSFLVLPRGINLWGSPAIALGLAIVALLVIAVVAWLIARAFGRPIGELQRAARLLASGDTSARVPAALAARRDELGQLALDFNAMADQLSALLASRQQLMAELSHELRSPLARLQAALALAAHRQTVGEAERERIEQEVQRMDRVIGDLLRFSRLEAAANLARRLLRLDELLGELVRVEEVEASARGCRLELRAAGDLSLVGDPELLRSGLENILRNAIRYAPRGSAVEISAERSGERLRVRIADRGPGVPAGQLGRIFEPYVRVAPGEPPTTGSGLGLAIARRVFTAHGGNVSAAARDGGGLEVTVDLPALEIP